MTTQADKGGGTVIMDSADYTAQMRQLLKDKDTHMKKSLRIQKQRPRIVAVSRILNQMEAGKKLMHLLEKVPQPPSMRGFSQDSPTWNTQVRSITSD